MKVGIVMGSVSDRPVMDGASQILRDFGVEHEVKILSAHRTPAALEAWVSSLRERGFAAVIAAAGGAAHLAGVCAAFTTLPVIGVPIKGRSTEGLDSLLSMVQMPSGIPVACVAIDGAKNAALLAIEMMAVTDLDLKLKLDNFREMQAAMVLANNEPEAL
ncbi:MAG: 5-(carboxyamino)imidazole ribonucleotide mutase [Muribaculaceae bacterium]|nr:5-(carboxyamino)imidazole ribonucleotide mutase [Muribaculaceae bacterium]